MSTYQRTTLYFVVRNGQHFPLLQETNNAFRTVTLTYTEILMFLVFVSLVDLTFFSGDITKISGNPTQISGDMTSGEMTRTGFEPMTFAIPVQRSTN